MWPVLKDIKSHSQGSISQKRKMLGVCPGRNVEVCITLYNSAHYTELSFLWDGEEVEDVCY